MEKVSKAELMNALGGKAYALTPCEELVVEANQHGSDWDNKNGTTGAKILKRFASRLILT